MRIFDDLEHRRRVRDRGGLRSGGKQDARGHRAGTASPFREVFEFKRSELAGVHVEELAADIDRQGDALEAAPSVTQFERYREAVRRLVGAVLPHIFAVTRPGRAIPATCRPRSTTS